jgi:hypothetical protein
LNNFKLTSKPGLSVTLELDRREERNSSEKGFEFSGRCNYKELNNNTNLVEYPPTVKEFVD